MHKSGIIRVAKYNQWLSNIVSVRKKNGKMRVCVEYRDLNLATPKDVYPMLVADMLVDAVGDFLGFIVHQRGIEVPEDEANAVINVSPPRTKKELQRLLGKINFLRQFISNSAGKIQPFSLLLKLQGQNEFVWEPKHQKAFDKIRAYLVSPPVLVPPRAGFPLKLYISAAEASIGSLLTQDAEEGIEHAIFYVSRTLTDYETRYTPMEKLCLTLYFLACLEVLLELGVRDIQVRGDSLLIINQLREKFRYELAQLATGITLKYGVRERILKVERRKLPSWLARPDPPDEPTVAVLDPIDVDWWVPLITYLKQPDSSTDRKIRFLALNYFLRNDELRRCGEDGMNFRCVYGREAKRLMREAHHKFIIVATDFFTKWVKAEPLKEASGATIRQFIFNHIICRFGVPEVLVSDRGAAFMGRDMAQLVADLGIQFIHSTPYYAQSNGQAEASNKIVITLLKKMLAENPRQWHETLYETLWAYRTFKHSPTTTTPYALMFGHEVVLPLEINV
ncbi:uncharacterized protein LOC112194368 [Rosa chinensis]|uniref:uncharacterized protein LOC112194368 n=1 Tax=Rosa chinensis TaxID=74649 RepID=UPI000D089451|nr:uncharacterized protein LOC112194368 [Rosa chinensis]